MNDDDEPLTTKKKLTLDRLHLAHSTVREQKEHRKCSANNNKGKKD